MDHITAIATITRTVGARVVLVTGALVLLTACPSKEPSSCPDEVDVLPPFAVTVRAEDGPLPPDTLIRLAYGSGEEEYALEAPSDGLVMFCKPAGTPAAAGAGGETVTTPTEALLCEIWEEGAVTLRVSGGDYPELIEELEGEADECG